jgi:CRP/FNR family cyclic AMP-dependent transcriptional regulator
MDYASTRPLARVKLFSGVQETDLLTLAAQSQPSFFGPGQVISSTETDPNRLVIILTGEARALVVAPNGRSVHLRGSPDLPFSSFFLNERPSDMVITIEAAQPTTALFVRAPAFLQFLSQHPAIYLRLLAQQADEFADVVEQFVEVVTLSVKARLIRELLKLARTANVSQNSATISDPPTHVELARRINSNRETVSREISRLQYDGMLVRTEDSLIIPDIRRLGHVSYT